MALSPNVNQTDLARGIARPHAGQPVTRRPRRPASPPTERTRTAEDPQA